MNLKGQDLIDYLNREIITGTLLETLKIRFVSATERELTAQMPVIPEVHQPMGLLHGGATAALAESVGSTASHLFIDIDKNEIRGIALSINHLRSKKEGMVYATAKPIHIGRTTHLWEIIIVDEKDKLIAHAKLTNIVLKK
jgi:uncharacterized protein (TIGR00369 family)